MVNQKAVDTKLVNHRRGRKKKGSYRPRSRKRIAKCNVIHSKTNLLIVNLKRQLNRGIDK